MPIAYDPAPSRAWKEDIRRQAAQQVKEPLIGPLSLYVHFRMPRAKSNKDEYHTKKPDTSNLLKIFEDAIEGIAYDNDSQIVMVMATKKYCDEKYPTPSIQATIQEINTSPGAHDAGRTNEAAATQTDADTLP